MKSRGSLNPIKLGLAVVLVLPLTIAISFIETPGQSRERPATSKTVKTIKAVTAKSTQTTVQAILHRGQSLYGAAVKFSSHHLRQRNLLAALSDFDEAIRLIPGDAQGHFWRGKALFELGRMKEAIPAFLQVRKLQPDFGDLYTVAFKLGIAYSKRGEFEAAIVEYDRAERLIPAPIFELSDGRNARTTLQSNAAEALMALGRLNEAIYRYRQALSLQPNNILTWWGLAVALDRDEQSSKAYEAINRCLASDSEMQKLSSEGVFFIPPGDVHYYRALGYQVRGDVMASIKEWERFLVASPESPWSQRARTHLTQLKEGIASVTAAPRLGRQNVTIPKPGLAEEDDLTAQDQTAIRYRLSGRMDSLRQCYLKELRQIKALEGSIQLNVAITREGRLGEIKVIALSKSLHRSQFLTCVQNAIKTLAFSPLSSGKTVKLNYPVEFRLTP